MEGYTRKNYRNLRMFIKDSIVSAYPDKQWKDICLSFFKEEDPDSIQKAGTYKTILKVNVLDTPCILKKYRNHGLARSIKSLFFPSRALQEFQAAVYIYKKAIPTPAPILMAEIRRKGVTQESIIALPFLTGAQELRDAFFHKNFFSVSEKREILNDFGRLTAWIFLQGVFQYDYSLNNFMLRKENERHHLYFIDFERVKIKRKLSKEQKFELLAKLNRVGREVALTDRFRFLKGYLEADPGITENFKEVVLALQKKTITILQRDLNRNRLTSIYTHGNYNRIKLDDYNGLYKKGYVLEDIVRKVKDIPNSISRANVTLQHYKSEQILTAVQFQANNAIQIWSSISTLIIAGFPLELPDVLVRNSKRGFVMLRSSAYEKLFRKKVPTIIREEFAHEMEALARLLNF